MQPERFRSYAARSNAISSLSLLAAVKVGMLRLSLRAACELNSAQRRLLEEATDIQSSDGISLPA